MTLPAGWVLSPAIAVDQAAGHAYRASFRGEGAAIIVAIAIAESGLVPNQRNVNTDSHRSTDRGILQINSYWHPEVSDAEADDPAKAFVQAYRISRGGVAFGQWATYTGPPSPPAYKRHLEVARAAVRRTEALAGGGALPASTSIDLPVRGDVVSGAIPASLEAAGATALTVTALKVRGQRWDRLQFSRWVTGAMLELSVDEASMLSLRVADPIGSGFYFTIATEVDLADLRFSVTAIDSGPSGSALEELALTILSAGVERLRQAESLGTAHTWSNTTAAQVLSREAGYAGLRFVGEGGPVYPTLTRLGTADKGEKGGATTAELADRAESNWEFSDRLARREGKWRFEAAGTLYFGRPSWLVAKLTRFTVRWRQPPGPGHFTPLEAPVLGVAVDDTTPGRIGGPRTISVLLPRGLADRIRPGMVMLYSGTTGWTTKPFATTRDAIVGYLVTRVSIDLLDDGAGVIVEGREAVDPKPVPEEGDTTDTSTSTTLPDAPRSTMRASALDMVTAMLAQVGDAFRLGAEADPKDPDPDEFDCSELVQWACAQVGLTFVDGSSAQIAAVAAADLELTVAAASTVRGALLWREGHVAVSLGDGTHTIEARGREYGVVTATIGARFTRAGYIPGLYYGVGTVSRSTPPLR